MKSNMPFMMYSDVISDVLYDRLPYPAKAGDRLTFFQSPLGPDRNELDTNMYLASMLPIGQRFLAESIEIVFLPAVGLSRAKRIADINAVARSGVMRFVIQNRQWAMCSPLAACPPVHWWYEFGPRGDKDNERNSNFQDYLRAQLTEQFRETDYGAFGGVPFMLIPIYIEGQQCFAVQVTEHANLPSGKDGTIYARMRGRLMRPNC